MPTVLSVLVAMVLALGTFAPVEARFHKTLQEVVGHPERSAECLKDGDTKVVRRIVGHTIAHAKAQYKIVDIVKVEDEQRASKELYDFLNWKLGSPSAVCGQYATAGQKHFDKGYSDEAAAALMGLELPGAGRAEFRLPKVVSDQLKSQIQACAQEIAGKTSAPTAAAGSPSKSAPGQVAAARSAPGSSTAPGSQPTLRSQLEGQVASKLSGISPACKQQVGGLEQQLQKEYGIPPELTDHAVNQVANAAVKAVDRVGFNMPKSWDVDNAVVIKLINARRVAPTAAR